MDDDDLIPLRLDKTVFSVCDPFDNSEEKRYWHSRTPAERLLHLEYLRRINYGDRALGPVERVMEVVRVSWP